MWDSITNGVSLYLSNSEYKLVELGHSSNRSVKAMNKLHFIHYNGENIFETYFFFLLICANVKIT